MTAVPASDRNNNELRVDMKPSLAGGLSHRASLEDVE
jgi:hypothetical protein